MIPSLAADTQNLDSGTSSSNTGSIVGGVLGGAAGLGILVAGAVFLVRRGQRKHRRPQRPDASPMDLNYEDDFYADPHRTAPEYGWSSPTYHHQPMTYNVTAASSSTDQNSSNPGYYSYNYDAAAAAGVNTPLAPSGPVRIDIPHYRD